ncbi:teichuronic acid biosynthesis protein TuaG [Sporolactobacillus pectinivorans]|uniref:teichuronic acid biosynthesis protein TuaG n=1 Tax=Sporolactobacillus pectinivorans TaxID=1591408 RepID=UPI000C25E047|nr:glycosyltransferase family 2 protein [Sporolactobacillus pectinivorans]
MPHIDPEVSVITPSYNVEKTIEATIRSVLGQTFRDWEMIIADDCSTDRTRMKLAAAEFADERIHTVFLGKNSGAAAARNMALDLARGRYIAFLDSDDCWKPEKLEKQLDFMKKNGYAFSFTGYEYINSDGVPLHKVVKAPARVVYQDMLKNTIVGCLTVMIDRKQAGRFSMPNLRSRQDLATWLGLLKKGIVAYGLNETLSEYRISGKTSLSGNKWKAARKTWFVYRQVEKLPMLLSFWYFCHYAAHALIKRF